MCAWGYIARGFKIEYNISIYEDIVLEERFEKKEIFEDLKYGGRPFLQCVMKFPLFTEKFETAAELNALIGDLMEKCRAGLEASVLTYLAKNFESLSLYEQKFKFKPYKYSLDFCVSELDDEIISLVINVMLSQNGRCVMKNRVPIFWHAGFGCLCEKE